MPLPVLIVLCVLGYVAIVVLFVCICITGHDEDVREHDLLQETRGRRP